MSDSVKITLTEAARNEDSLSHLFGAPILPEDLRETVSAFDATGMFFGQFDLSELAPYDRAEKLPHAGHLYLFLDTALYPYRAISLYSTGEPLYVLDGYNEEVPDFERFTVPYAMSFETVREDSDGTKLFGAPTWEQEDGAELFLQYDPLDNETDFLVHIDGYALFTFGRGKRRLTDIRFRMDYS